MTARTYEGTINNVYLPTVTFMASEFPFVAFINLLSIALHEYRMNPTTQVTLKEHELLLEKVEYTCLEENRDLDETKVAVENRAQSRKN